MEHFAAPAVPGRRPYPWPANPGAVGRSKLLVTDISNGPGRGRSGLYRASGGRSRTHRHTPE